ncbi:hypothetical protein [Streptomyces sp. NBC_00829]|uniref:hypothetical protein n=1 Tax=Streptomyces sp. NBC_00829 TaxID=2903679 RepID=UPI003870D156|nr:hypothetical protein OG293_23140 [Streptomyces sp. NBC_00829]
MPYDLGAQVPLGTTVKDGAGALANAGGMALTITLPDASTVTVSSVLPSSTGVYAYDYPTVQPGRHSVRWVATGINAGAYTDVFDVREATPPLLFSLASAKAQLDITTTEYDEELREYIAATTQAVEFFVGAVVRRSVTQPVRGGSDRVVLDTTPVLAVTSMTALGTWQESVPVDVLNVADAESGVLRRTDGLVFTQCEYHVEYVAGRTAVRPNIALAGKMILQHLWRTQYGAARGMVGGGDDFSVTEPIPGLGYSIPNRALQLLQGDRLPGGIA